ncbi:hypothetical protein MLD38_040173 [Melastoma candidum]|uniref:Uncharacterized protein n=1 Tax=Melastoma candidum TaxID=119954 RepID=A0ACB9L4J2_9MYRT|nr:hypothetical protein MLD38_040173 [Melastoma candidum]
MASSSSLLLLLLLCVTTIHYYSGQTESLIQALNLFPEETVNIVGADVLAESSLIEKKLDLGLLGDSGSSVADLGHHAGYFRLPNTKASRVEEQQQGNPVVIWLTGGPGCISAFALFYENGPFHITNNLSLAWNYFRWDKVSNIIYVDQPTGTGFSYTTDQSDLRHDEAGAFFKEHPDYVGNDFFIAGESYAGHYIPAFTERVNRGNKAKEGIHINLKGLAIGNGLTDPEIQYGAYADYALSMNLITQTDYGSINQLLQGCRRSIQLCSIEGGDSCMSALDECNAIVGQIISIAGNINYYDIRKQCEGQLCYDLSNLEKFLNQQYVRNALGVGNIRFVSCSSAVHDAMLTDWMQNLEVGIPALLEQGIKTLIYAGEFDLICNWLGNSRWVHAMLWSGQKDFEQAADVSFVVDGAEAGILKNHGPLTFLKVHDAGHMVPMD